VEIRNVSSSFWLENSRVSSAKISDPVCSSGQEDLIQCLLHENYIVNLKNIFENLIGEELIFLKRVNNS
jgi:hypothetical protein